MGTDIHGWIECRNTNIDTDDEQIWFPTVDFGRVYLGRDYDVFALLFGVRNCRKVQPLAAERGLPKYISSEIKARATESSSFFSHTWITWHELKQSSWRADIYWEPAMKIMEILADIYGDKNVCLIVWFED